MMMQQVGLIMLLHPPCLTALPPTSAHPILVQSLLAFLPEFDRMAALLHEEGLCSRALAKERLLPAADLAGMCSAHCAMPVGAPVKQG